MACISEDPVNENYEIKYAYYEDGRVESKTTIDKKTGLEASINGEASEIMYEKNGNVAFKFWRRGKDDYRENGLPEWENYCAGILHWQLWTNNAQDRLYHGLPNKVKYFIKSDLVEEENYFLKDKPFYNPNKRTPINVYYKKEPVHHIWKKEWYTDKPGDLQDNDLAQSVEYNHLGAVTKRVYYYANHYKLPTQQIYDASGKYLLEEIWEVPNSEGKLIMHRENEPARILYVDNKPFLLEYYTDGKLTKTEAAP